MKGALYEFIIPNESYSIEIVDPHVQVLGTDAAVVAFNWRDKADFGEDIPPLTGGASLIFELRGEQWKITHIHESPVTR